MVRVGVRSMTAFDKAWTILKATVQEMRDYQPTDEQMDRFYNWGNTAIPIAPKGYTITPEDKEKHKDELKEFQDDLAYEASFEYDPNDYNPPKEVFDNLHMKYGTPRIGPIMNPDGRMERHVQNILDLMDKRKKEGYL